jgi:hypothetical protein
LEGARAKKGQREQARREARWEEVEIDKTEIREER